MYVHDHPPKLSFDKGEVACHWEPCTMASSRSGEKRREHTGNPATKLHLWQKSEAQVTTPGARFNQLSLFKSAGRDTTTLYPLLYSPTNPSNAIASTHQARTILFLAQLVRPTASQPASQFYRFR